MTSSSHPHRDIFYWHFRVAFYLAYAFDMFICFYMTFCLATFLALSLASLLAIFWHIVWCQKILSGFLLGIFSAIFFWHIFWPGVVSGIFFGFVWHFLLASYLAFYRAHLPAWHILRPFFSGRSIWHIVSHSFWRSTWHFFWHSTWQFWSFLIWTHLDFCNVAVATTLLDDQNVPSNPWQVTSYNNLAQTNTCDQKRLQPCDIWYCPPWVYSCLKTPLSLCLARAGGDFVGAFYLSGFWHVENKCETTQANLLLYMHLPKNWAQDAPANTSAWIDVSWCFYLSTSRYIVT